MRQQRLSQTKTTVAYPQPNTATSTPRSVHPVVQLQAEIGNRAVNRLLEAQRRGSQSEAPESSDRTIAWPRSGILSAKGQPIQAKLRFQGLSQELTGKLPPMSNPIQTKLVIGKPGDKYEQEADQVATQVVSQINAPANQPSEEVQTFQRQELDSSQELAIKPVVQQTGDSAATTNISHHVVQCMRIPPQAETYDQEISTDDLSKFKSIIRDLVKNQDKKHKKRRLEYIRNYISAQKKDEQEEVEVLLAAIEQIEQEEDTKTSSKESKQELEEEAKQESEEISVSPSSTGLEVDTKPKMKSQWGFGSSKFIVDLNCGWYCESAAIDYWAKKLNLTLQENILPKETLFGYRPGTEGQKFAKAHSKPGHIKYWQQLLKSEGPLIVSGKLGAAFWLPAGGHYILIVDVDVEQNKLKYLDPLQSSTIKSESFDYMQPRIKKIYSINVDELKKRDLK